MNESLQKDRSSSQPLHQHHLQHQYHDQYFGQLPAGGRERHSGGRVPGGLPRAGGAEAERVATTSQPTPMSPSHKPLMISQPRRTRLAGLTLHVCRFCAEASLECTSATHGINLNLANPGGDVATKAVDRRRSISCRGVRQRSDER